MEFVLYREDSRKAPKTFVKNIWQFFAPKVSYQDRLCTPKCKGRVLSKGTLRTKAYEDKEETLSEIFVILQ